MLQDNNKQEEHDASNHFLPGRRRSQPYHIQDCSYMWSHALGWCTPGHMIPPPRTHWHLRISKEIIRKLLKSSTIPKFYLYLFSYILLDFTINLFSFSFILKLWLTKTLLNISKEVRIQQNLTKMNILHFYTETP